MKRPEFTWSNIPVTGFDRSDRSLTFREQGQEPIGVTGVVLANGGDDVLHDTKYVIVHFPYVQSLACRAAIPTTLRLTSTGITSPRSATS